MRRAVLLAHPAGHSLSPVMHDAAFAARGIEARYEAWEVAPGDLRAAVARIRDDDTVLGANVTVPHKRAVVPFLNALEGEATAIGAVNTLRKDGGRLVGANTDAEGFLRALADARLDPAGRVVVLIGAGGAARAVAWALVRAAAAEVRVTNRTVATARSLVEEVGRAAADRPGRDGPTTRIRTVEADDEGRRGVDWWINATSVGMERGGVAPDASPLASSAFARRVDARRTPAAAIDLVYRPRRTRFLREAEAAGLVTVDGLGMLVHQGAAAFEAWTGQEAPVEAMRAAVEARLAGEAPA